MHCGSGEATFRPAVCNGVDYLRELRRLQRKQHDADDNQYGHADPRLAKIIAENGKKYLRPSSRWAARVVPGEESDAAQEAASNWSGRDGIEWRAGQPRPPRPPYWPSERGVGSVRLRPLPASAGSPDLLCDIRTATAIFILAGVEFSGPWRVYPRSVSIGRRQRLRDAADCRTLGIPIDIAIFELTAFLVSARTEANLLHYDQ